MKYIYALGLFFCSCVLVKAQPQMKLKQERIELGQVEWKHPVKITYDLVNTGDKPLILSNVTASCGCTSVDWTKEVIPSQGTGTVTAVFDAEMLGSFEKDVAVYSNSNPTLTYLSFGGKVVTKVTDFDRKMPVNIGSFRLKSALASFGVVSAGGTDTLDIAIANDGGKALPLQIMHLPPYLGVQYLPKVLDAQSSGHIKLFFVGTPPVYGQQEAVCYLSRFPGDEVGNENLFPIEFTYVPKEQQMTASTPIIGVSDDTLDLTEDMAKHRSKIKRTVEIFSRGKEPLQILRVQCFDPSVSAHLRKSTIASGKSTKLSLQLDTKKMNELDDRQQVILITNDPLRPVITIELRWQVEVKK